MPGQGLLELEIAPCDMNFCISRPELFLQGPATFFYFMCDATAQGFRSLPCSSLFTKQRLREATLDSSRWQPELVHY